MSEQPTSTPTPLWRDPVTSGFPDGQPGKSPPEEMGNPDYQTD